MTERLPGNPPAAAHQAKWLILIAEFERARMGEARVCDNLSGGPAGAVRGRPSPAEKCAQHRTPRIVTTLYTLNGAAGELGVLVSLETAQCVSLGRLPAPGTRARCRCGHGTIKTRVVRDPAMDSAILHPTHTLPLPARRAFQAIESCQTRNRGGRGKQRRRKWQRAGSGPFSWLS